MGATRTARAAHTDGRVERGDRTRRLVLGRTMEIASVEGLEGLSLGRIATELGLSKSGVFALFGSKEELQLATVRAARAVFVDRVVRPVEDLAPGVARVRRLCAGWLDYSRERVFPGGCFFHGVAAEFDARSGPVHDAVAEALEDWSAFVGHVLEEARLAGELRADAPVERLGFELCALLEAANAWSVLRGDDQAYDWAADSITERLRTVAADPSALPDRLGG